MKKSFLRCLGAGLVALALLWALASCGNPYDDSEVVSAAAELIEASYEINGIYFGEGLPYDEKDGLSDIRNYYKVAEDSPYATEADLRDATLAVYSEQYALFLFEKAFTGYSVDFGEADADSTEIVLARYLTDGEHFLVRRVADAEKLELKRTYDTENIKVVSGKRSGVTVSVPSFLDGVPDADVELTVVKTENGWRLDTPTY